MKEESQHSQADLDLEARIVALVLGEASPQERDALNQLIEERPELAELKAQFESVHALLCDVGMEHVAEEDDWKLSTEKRDAVLAVIDADEGTHAANRVVQPLFDARRWAKPHMYWNSFSKIAAIFCIAGFFGLLMLSTLVTRSSQLAANARFAPSRIRPEELSAALVVEGLRSQATTKLETDSRLSTRLIPGAGAKIVRNFAEPDSSAYKGFDVAESPTTSLAGIRDSLGAASAPDQHYLADKVQYFSADGATRELTQPANLGQPAQPTTELYALNVPNGWNVTGGTSQESLWGSSSGSATRDAKQLANDGEPQSNKGRELAEFGFELGELELKWDSKKAPETALPDLGAQVVELQQGLGREPASQAGARYRFFEDPSDAPAEEQRSGNEGFPQKGNSIVKGRGQDSSGSSGGIELDAISALPSLEQSGETVAEREYATWSELGLPNQAVTQPVIAGMQEKVEKEQVADVIEQDLTLLAFPEELADLESVADEQDVKKSGVVSGAELLAVDDSRIAGTTTQMAPDATGNHDAGTWRYEALGKSLEDQAPRGEERLADSAETSRESRPAPGNKEEGEPLSQSEEIVPSGTVAPRSWSRMEIVDSEWFGRSDFEERPPVRKFVAPAGFGEDNAQEQAFSTFSLHVSDVSFKLALAALAQGQWPEAAKIRIEEFVNAFHYDDPLPSPREKVACRVEQSIHPFLQQRNVLRVSMRTAAAGRASNTPLRLTLLLDNSGSMERIDRRQTVRRAFGLLAEQLKSIDQVTLISFARQPRLLADKVSGAQLQQLVQAIEDLPSEGGTNIEAALQLAFEKAQEQQTDGAQNRIILLTDGAVNLGDADPESLSNMVTTMRDAGIAFDAAGISADGLNDEVLEALTRKGDGRYYLLDSLESVDDGFASQIAGALRPSAKNVKVQIEFNPKRVGRYKLLGFEKHLLNQADFRNDAVDAAEMAAAEAGVAVYQFEAKPDGEGDVGSVSVRFRDLSTGQMIENRWPIPYQADAPRADQAAPSLRIATSAALLAAKLRGEPLGEAVDLKSLSELTAALPDPYRSSKRVQQLRLMIDQARQIGGN